jgi:hypothetical protein
MPPAPASRDPWTFHPNPLQYGNPSIFRALAAMVVLPAISLASLTCKTPPPSEITPIDAKFVVPSVKYASLSQNAGRKPCTLVQVFQRFFSLWRLTRAR